MTPMAYYFAYGDRMNSESMTNAVPAARFVGPGRLDGYRLAFNVFSRSWGGGGANAVPDRTAGLWGVLWEIPDGDMAALEPVNRPDDGTDPELDVEVVGPAGPVHARTFAVASHEAFIRPTDRYADLLKAVAEGHGLPAEALAEIDRARLGPQAPAPRI
jgi:hypothetical protein